MKDNRTHGYVIIHSETGDRIGGTYSSKGGATNSFNQIAKRTYSSHPARGLVFQSQNSYVIKRLVIADE